MNYGYMEETEEMPIMVNSKTPETVMIPMRIKKNGLNVDVDYVFDKNLGRYRLFTDCLKYGSNLEIVYGCRKGCFVIKDLDKLRMEWNKLHPDMVRKDTAFEKFLDVKI